MENIIWKDRVHHLGMPISLTKYSLSETRLFTRAGLFTTVDEELQLFRVRDIRVTRTLLDRLFKCGTVTLFSSDKSSPQLDLKHVKRPIELKEQLVKLIAAEREKHHIFGDDLLSNVAGTIQQAMPPQ